MWPLFLKTIYYIFCAPQERVWDGLPAKATIYYNAYDTSKAKRGLQDNI